MAGLDNGIFRKVAIDHYLQGEEGGSVLKITPPWTWALFWSFVVLMVLAFFASVFFHVEVKGYGRGVVRPVQGVRTLIAQVSGMVEAVDRRPGDLVSVGDQVLRLDSAPVRGQILEADRQLMVLRTEFKRHSAMLVTLSSRQEDELRGRVVMLEEQIRSQEGSLLLFDRKVKANERLEKEGMVSTMNVDEAREALAQAKRQANSNRQTLASTLQELASHHARVEDERWKREQDLRDAQNKRDALEFSLDQTRVLAPVEGVVDALLVKPGDVVQPGQVIGRILPKDAPLEVISFLPEKDRAFVHPGDQARIELDQYPYAEFGSVAAKVLRVAGDLASAQELQQALGEGTKPESPAFRVDLQMEDTKRTKIKPGTLRSGMLLHVRFSLRRQRPIALLFEPLRGWLD